MKRFQQAYAAGTYQLVNNKDKGLAVLAKRLRLKNPKGIEETYQYFARKFSFPTRCIARRSANKYLDESTLDELEREGFLNDWPERADPLDRTANTPGDQRNPT